MSKRGNNLIHLELQPDLGSATLLHGLRIGGRGLPKKFTALLTEESEPWRGEESEFQWLTLAPGLELLCLPLLPPTICETPDMLLNLPKPQVSHFRNGTLLLYRYLLFRFLL